jgi:hypothetical protein
MALADSTARKQVEEPAPLYRSAPHNIEAEQALLGAILVNNEAFYRVSDFLEPTHFFEPIHQKVYQLARDLIRAGKLATPVTLKTFLDGNIDIGGLTVSQYLARLAAEATTIINAEDYGHTVYDLSIRRALIQVGEDMVNVAIFLHGIKSKTRNEDFTSWRKPVDTTGASSASRRRSPRPSTWPHMLSSAMANFRAPPPGSMTSTG